MAQIRTDWNNLSASSKPFVFALACSIWTIDILGLFIGYPVWFDEIVTTENALGANYSNITGIHWAKYFNPSFSHTNMLDRSESVILAYSKFE